jgi:hypothetical protein
MYMSQNYQTLYAETDKASLELLVFGQAFSSGVCSHSCKSIDLQFAAILAGVGWSELR